MRRRQRKKNAYIGGRRALSWSDRVFVARMMATGPGSPADSLIVGMWDHDAVMFERKIRGWTRTRLCSCHLPGLFIDGEQGGDLGPQMKPPTRRSSLRSRRR